jgi:NhaP-type Na+/H+ or K+/H+ antiporter
MPLLLAAQIIQSLFGAFCLFSFFSTKDESVVILTVVFFAIASGFLWASYWFVKRFDLRPWTQVISMILLTAVGPLVGYLAIIILVGLGH